MALKKSRQMLILALCIVVIMQVQPTTAFGAHNFDAAKIDALLQSAKDENNLAGFTVAITYQDELVFAKAYGDNLDTNSKFPIASLSKPITSFAVLQLVDKGLVDLDTPIKTYLPELEMDDSHATNITVRQLLSHTSGLSDKTFPEMKLSIQPKNLSESIEFLKGVKLMNNPGEKYHYHNPNYWILARLVEVKSGENFSDYLNKHIFFPLQMNYTMSFSNTNQFQSIKNMAAGHLNFFGINVLYKEPDWFIDGPSGVVSTATDLSNWLIMIMNDGIYNGQRIISSDSLKEMQTLQENTSYGLGWSIRDKEEGKIISHSGILWTYQADERILLGNGYAMVVLYNNGLNAFTNYGAIADSLTELLTTGKIVTPTVTYHYLELIIVFLLLFALGKGIYNLRNLDKWKRKNVRQYVIRSAFMLIPVAILISIPGIITFLTNGRVMSLYRTFLVMPSIYIWLITATIINVIVVVKRGIEIKSN
jgi:CubicO group peptidase (beta-lactamase class C family)